MSQSFLRFKFKSLWVRQQILNARAGGGRLACVLDLTDVLWREELVVARVLQMQELSGQSAVDHALRLLVGNECLPQDFRDQLRHDVLVDWLCPFSRFLGWLRDNDLLNLVSLR